MNAQHTPGRLTVRGGYSIYADDGKTPVADTCLTNSVPDNDEANARRLVACWNWCEGQDTDGLELSTKIGRTAKDFITEAYAKELELIAQRDELLAALKLAERHCPVGSTAEILARAAIAKTEGVTK